MKTREISDCIVLIGPELEPWLCSRFAWRDETVIAVDRVRPMTVVDHDTLVIIPGLINAHTHMGDSCWPDGATGLTLEQGFFRPDGFKYRELAKIDPDEQLRRMVEHLRYMARTGTIAHFDFREQGVHGAELLRRASEITGVDSVILSQFDQVPYSPAELEKNVAPLPAGALVQLRQLLEVADGFSESTMNDLTDPSWCQIRDETRAAGKLRAIHCLENEGYRDVSLARTGRGDLIRALEYLQPHLVIHLTVADARETAFLAASRATAVLNPRANANLGLPVPPVRLLMDAGVNLMLGTDNGLLNSPNLFAELDFTYKLAKSQFGDVLRPDPRRILQMATSNVPACFGAQRRGFLEAGLPASFVVLDFSQPHLRHSRHVPASVVSRVTPEDVLATYRLGRPLYQASHYDHESAMAPTSASAGTALLSE
ncbi:amidohydrolase [Opitutaceae bacterium EW11]|nr:amidohydrolase [Opitutaceae bacterium EW11]